MTNACFKIRVVHEKLHWLQKFLISYLTVTFLRPYLVASKSLCAAAVTLLSNAELDTLALGQTDPWLFLANDAETVLAIAAPIALPSLVVVTYKTLVSRVVNSLSTASLTWTMLKPPS